MSLKTFITTVREAKNDDDMWICDEDENGGFWSRSGNVNWFLILFSESSSSSLELNNSVLRRAYLYRNSQSKKHMFVLSGCVLSANIQEEVTDTFTATLGHKAIHFKLPLNNDQVNYPKRILQIWDIHYREKNNGLQCLHAVLRNVILHFFNYSAWVLLNNIYKPFFCILYLPREIHRNHLLQWSQNYREEQEGTKSKVHMAHSLDHVSKSCQKKITVLRHSQLLLSLNKMCNLGA